MMNLPYSSRSLCDSGRSGQAATLKKHDKYDQAINYLA